ncbi:MAG TPA: PAS domain S-box protein [Pseudomonas xinjiangensis]|uniref:histidine kinase n=2 Tax=root TaxID=1 RepID=A0A7V1FU51_9GAMM|nr:PAS domain S-box protein [Halopseudomonas xinjiangensis]HEC47260.1 PAS domain S-box protein [Halopseudomonas xinjiangensis]
MARPSLRGAGRLIIPAAIIALAFFFLILALSGWQQRENQWAQQLAAQAEIQRLAIVQSQQALKRQALMAASTLVGDPDTLRLVRRMALISKRDGMTHPNLLGLRAQLLDDLSGYWSALQQAGANQLHIHLSPGVVSLVRMHRPDEWGDDLANSRPLLANAQASGQTQSGMEVGRFGLGMIGVAPITRDESPLSPTVATLEVGFGMLPELRQLDADLKAGLAVLLHDPTMNQLTLDVPAPLARSLDGQWLLDSYSRDEVLAWLAAGELPLSLNAADHQVLQSGKGHYLLTRIPVRDMAGEADPERSPVAMVLAWRDITEARAEHRLDQLVQLGEWVLAFAVATLVLIALLLVARISARKQGLKQARRQNQALRALNEVAGLPNLDLNERLHQALQIGCNYMGLDIGIVSQIEGQNFTILAQKSPGQTLRDGAVLDVSRTFCSLVLQQKDVLDLTTIGQSEFRKHPGYAEFGVESYIGAPLLLGGKFFGTLSFSSANPQRTAFQEIDIEFMRLCSRWISATLTRARVEDERETLLGRFNKLADHLPGMVYQYQHSADGRGWFPYSSDCISEIYGIMPHEAAISADLAYERVHPDDRAAVVESIGRSAETLQVWRAEYRILHPRNGELWVAGFASPERLPNNDIVWHGFIADITARKHIELTLDRERSRLASIIQSTNIGTGEWNIQTGEVTFNERWAQIIGYTLKELQPTSIKTLADLSHPDDIDEANVLLKRHFAGESRFMDYRFRVRHKDGRWVWMHGRGKLISRDEAGRPLIMMGTHSDVTEEVQRNEEIRQARSFLRAVINASTEVAIIAIDLSGIITLFNSGAEKLLGYSAAEVTGLHTPELFHLPSEMQRRAITLEEELGQPIDGLEVFLAKVRNGNSETLPWTYVRKDSTQRLVNLTITRIADECNEVIGFLGMANDISELIQATRALQKSESRFRSMVSNLPGAVYRCQADQAWTMSYMSDEIAQITGYPASDFIDNQRRSFASVIHPEDLHLTFSCMERIERRENYELTYRIVHADGHEVWVREKGRGEYDGNGKLLSLSGFLWDVTEQYRVEQMKSRFVSTVSHELRTPLTVVTGTLALVTGGVLGNLTPPIQKALDTALGNSRNLNILINDLLDMDKLTVDQMRFDLQRQSLAPLLQQALESNRGYAEQYDVALQSGHTDDVWVTVDALRLGQVLANYLSNAAKFSHPGGLVTLETQLHEGRIRIEVTDQGDGIPEEFHGQLFSKFFQVDSSDTRKRGGTGLGLAITRELMLRMGGTVGFDSQVGEGSVFWCELEAEPIIRELP